MSFLIILASCVSQDKVQQHAAGTDPVSLPSGLRYSILKEGQGKAVMEEIPF